VPGFFPWKLTELLRAQLGAEGRVLIGNVLTGSFLGGIDLFTNPPPMKANVILTCLLLILSSGLRAEEEGQAIPYNSVNAAMKLLEGRKMDGVECVPFFVRTPEGQPTLASEEANFRIVTWDGETVKLKCEPLDQVPAGELPEIGEKMKKDGYTHVLWVPKDVKAYLDGSMYHSLPKGGVTMSQGMAIKGKFKLGEKKDADGKKDPKPDPKKP
jgi:hypothetical protein